MKKYLVISMLMASNFAYAGGKETKEMIFCGVNLGAFPVVTYYLCYASLGSLVTCMGGPGFCFPALMAATATCGLSVNTVKGALRNCLHK
jgi:hypothetical protein